MTSELKPLADMHPCPPSSGGGKRHRSRVYADGRQHYCERCGEKIDATTFSNIPETYVTTHDAGDYNKTRAVPDVPELVRYSIEWSHSTADEVREDDNGLYVLHSQAAEIIAAKDKEINQLKADKQRLVEDRARFPDRPDDIGRMIEAEIGNRKEAEKQANHFAELYRKRAEAAEAKLAQYEAQEPKIYASFDTKDEDGYLVPFIYSDNEKLVELKSKQYANGLARENPGTVLPLYTDVFVDPKKVD